MLSFSIKQALHLKTVQEPSMHDSRTVEYTLCGSEDRIGPLHSRHVVRGNYMAFPTLMVTTGLPKAAVCHTLSMHIKGTLAIFSRRVGHCVSVVGFIPISSSLSLLRYDPACC